VRITDALAFLPVQFPITITPWLDGMPMPSSTVQSGASASRISEVRGGLGITSATAMSVFMLCRPNAKRSCVSGAKPMDVTLTTVPVPSGTR
jgi:hypothetical protein